MRAFDRCVLVMAVGALSSSPLALEAQRDRQSGGLGMTVWGDASYRGTNHTFVEDTPDLRAIGMDNLISSIRVASGEVWQVCDGYNYTGRCLVVSDEESDLRRRDWNDLISSVRRLRGGNAGPNQPGSGPRTLELYAGAQYSGQRVAVDEAAPDLRRVNFSDRTVSVRVPRGEVWELCVNINYDDCKVVDGDLPHLDSIQMTRLISSARRRISSGRGGAGGFAGQRRLTVYDRTDYAGRSVTITGTEAALGFLNNLEGSARIVGRWEFCDEPRFNGRCVTIDRDVRDLRTLNLRGRIESVRPR
jgi:hypothetical protein